MFLRVEASVPDAFKYDMLQNYRAKNANKRLLRSQ